MNTALLGTALVAAVVIAQFLDKVLKPLLSALSQVSGAERLAALKALWPFYVSFLCGAGLAWFTELNFLPVFQGSALVGRLLTCAFIGFGPAAIHDLKDAAETALAALQVLLDKDTTAPATAAPELEQAITTVGAMLGPRVQAYLERAKHRQA
jgi:hypothetical protein